MTSAQFVADVVDVVLALSKFTVAVSPILMALGPVLLPILAGSIKDKKHAQAFETVSRMGLLATNVAAEELAKGMAAAQAPDSPGGATVTQEEMAGIVAKAAEAAFKWARDQKVLDSVLDVYGGREAVLSSLRAIINAKLHGAPQGVALAPAKPIETPCPVADDKPAA